MAKISAELHNRLMDASRALRAENPDMAKAVMVPGASLTIGTPEHELFRKLMALSALASTFSGVPCRAADRKLALSLVGA